VKRRSIGPPPGQITVADMPDDLLRYPVFVPGEGASRWRPWRAALHAWLTEHDLRPTFLELEAERRRRWPIVDRDRPIRETRHRDWGAINAE
jgi:hypothetical protein